MVHKLLIGCDISSQSAINAMALRQKQKCIREVCLRKKKVEDETSLLHGVKFPISIIMSVIVTPLMIYCAVSVICIQHFIRCPCFFGLAAILSTLIRISGSDSLRLTKSRSKTYQGHPACSWKSDLPKGLEMVPIFF